MSTSSPEAAKASSPVATKSSLKGAKQSKIVKLKLSSYLLTKFPYVDDSPPQPVKSKSGQQSSSETPKPSASSPVEKSEHSNSTPNPSTTAEPDANGNKENKRKGIPGPKPGQKRSAPATEPDGTPKVRGKPGPKKRKIDGETGAPVPAPAPKLGPKANQGAINAQLRALDRTGKPCRRWAKRTVALKSFTGVAWDLPYWQSPKLKRDSLANDAQSQDTSSSEAKHDPTSSQVPSENSTGGKDPPSIPNGTSEINGAASDVQESTARSEVAAGTEHSPGQQPVEA